MSSYTYLLQRAAEFLACLAKERHRVGVWMVSSSRVDAPIQDLVAELGLGYINLLTELMPQLTDDSEKPLGVFGPDDLLRWLRKQSYAASSTAIVVDEIEPLLATFGKPRATELFRMATKLDARTPLLVVTRLGDLVAASGFPAERTWRIADEGDHGQPIH